MLLRRCSSNNSNNNSSSSSSNINNNSSSSSSSNNLSKNETTVRTNPNPNPALDPNLDFDTLRLDVLGNQEGYQLGRVNIEGPLSFLAKACLEIAFGAVTRLDDLGNTITQ